MTLVEWIRTFLDKNSSKFSTIDYWKKRARKYGARSVLDIRHTAEEYETATQMQKDTIYPYLKQLLTGREKVVLDYGCGPGRFTADLARIISGEAIGVDPIDRFIQMAPKDKKVKYILMQNGIIPLEDASIDAVWICLVFGGIVDDKDLRNNLAEIARVLKKDGLLFLVENTTEQADVEYWRFRSPKDYQTLCDFVELKHLDDYFDLGERISIMAGRKSV